MGIIKLLDVQQEAIDITERNGYYIHPCRMPLMTKQADKVVKTLVGLGNTITYTEMLIVLKTVTKHIELILESHRECGKE